MDTVGAYLKKEREAKNISLHEVSRLTKISEIYLDCLEKDEYEKLPKGPFVKGYISSYSKSIGCNEDEALKLYNATKSEKDEFEPTQPEISRVKGWRTSIGERLNSIVFSLKSRKLKAQNKESESSETDEQKKSYASLLEKSKSSFQSVAATVKSKSASLKMAVPQAKSLSAPLKKSLSSLTERTSKVKKAAISSIRKVSSLKKPHASVETIASSVQKKSESLKIVARIFKKTALTESPKRWLGNQLVWLYACFALFGACILVLAGFGFYHLFIFDKHQPLNAKFSIAQKTDNFSQSTTSSEKKSLLSKLKDTSVPSKQLEPGVQKNELLPLHTPPAIPALPKKEIVSGLSIASTIAAENIRVLKAIICSDVQNRMPVGVDTAFSSSVQRIYVWSQIEAKQIPSKIRHIYYLEGRKMSDVILNVGSSNWRTWSYKNIADIDYRGEWRVDIALANGEVLRSLNFQVQ